MEKNEFQNRVFLFLNFLGAAILNNCEVKWLPFCYKTKALCLITKGQPRHVTIIQDGGGAAAGHPDRGNLCFLP